MNGLIALSLTNLVNPFKFIENMNILYIILLYYRVLMRYIYYGCCQPSRIKEKPVTDLINQLDIVDGERFHAPTIESIVLLSFSKLLSSHRRCVCYFTTKI